MIGTVLRVLGLGAVVATVSETWFYPVELSFHVIELFLFYGPLVYLGWLAMAYARVRTWMGAFCGACLAGFLIEGIPVPFLYSGLPFTLLWTSIAWHALISMGVGLWVFRIIAAQKSPLILAVFCVLAGGYLGAWSVELWSVREDNSPWVWTPPDEYRVQMLVGWVVFVVGHMLLDVASRWTVKPWRGEVMVFAILITALFAVSPLILVFPLSLVLPLLAALSIWLMTKDAAPTGEVSPFLVRLSNLRVPFIGYAISALTPLTAIGVYQLLEEADIQLESSAFHILWAGPVSLGLVVWSIWKLLRRSSAAT